jgi:hypothetical protein
MTRNRRTPRFSSTFYPVRFSTGTARSSSSLVGHQAQEGVQACQAGNLAKNGTRCQGSIPCDRIHSPFSEPFCLDPQPFVVQVMCHNVSCSSGFDKRSSQSIGHRNVWMREQWIASNNRPGFSRATTRNPLSLRNRNLVFAPSLPILGPASSMNSVRTIESTRRCFAISRWDRSSTCPFAASVRSGASFDRVLLCIAGWHWRRSFQATRMAIDNGQVGI